MNRLIIYFLFWPIAISYAIGKEIKYPVSDIDSGLLKNAIAVTRLQDEEFRILDSDRAERHVHYAITILNHRAYEYSQGMIWYDKLVKVKDIQGIVYNALGEEVKKLKSKDILDQSYISGFSLYDDSRVKLFDLSYSEYPYTIEIEYTYDYKYLFSIPTFSALWDEGVPTEHARYALVYPTGLKPRVQVTPEDHEPLSEKLENITHLIWTFDHILPEAQEEFGPSWRETAPHIFIAPSLFEFEGYQGNMETWNGFGKWIAKLNAGRDVLPESTISEVRKLTNGLSNDREKVRAVYQYMQDNTRYVSIQLGIGGYQPFEAMLVDEKGYGDCKALSNYTVALLRSIGIQANYVLVRAGRDADDIRVDFPSTQFNHVIVNVPLEKDTVWLECTDQKQPFGFLGSFTSNRHALMITNQGAMIVKTPIYKMEENAQERVAQVHINRQGSATAKVQTRYGGLRYEYKGLDRLLDDQFDEQRKWVLSNTYISNFDIDSFQFQDQAGESPSALVTLKLTLKRLASGSGKRLFLTPNLMSAIASVPEKEDNRKHPIIVYPGFEEIDSIQYFLPEDIAPEFLPNEISFSSPFGIYHAIFQYRENQLLYVRKLRIIDGRFPADAYKEFYEFFKDINKADKTKVVFLVQ